MSETVRDLYQDMLDGKWNDDSINDNPWGYCQNWPEEILWGLCGSDADGNEYPQQHIGSMLNQVEDLGKWSLEEWELFFQRVRVEGI